MLMFGTFGVCVKTTEEINERPSYVHGRVLPVLASTVGACVLVTRVLPVLALEIIVVLCSWLRGWEDTRCCLLRGRRHPPREEESPLLHRLDFLSFFLLLHRLGQSAVNSKFLPFACLPHPEHLNRGDD